MKRLNKLYQEKIAKDNAIFDRWYEIIRGVPVYKLEGGMCKNSKGKVMFYNEVPQQYWSNLYYYHTYDLHSLEIELQLCKESKSSQLHDIAKIKQDNIEKNLHIINFCLAQLDLRFGGVLLDWKPIYENNIYKDEIECFEEWNEVTSTRKILTEKYK